MKTAKPKRNPTQSKKKKNTNATPRPRVQAQTTVPRPQPVKTQILLSQCARDYWHTLGNPTEDNMGCVPSDIPTTSFKQRCFARGTGSTGTTGLGMIVADPYNAAMNDIDCVAVSTSTFNSLTMTYSNPNVALISSNSNYAAIDIGDVSPKAQVRVVGAVLKIQFVGTRLNAGGIITAIQDRNHDTLANRTEANLASDLASRTFEFNEKPIYLYYYPAAPLEYDFVPVVPVSFNGIALTNDRYYMGAYITSAATSQKFWYEFFVVHEFQGRDIRGQTPSHTDPNAVAAASVVMANSYPTQQNPQTMEKSIFSKATDYLTQGVTTVTEGIQFAQNASTAFQTLSKATVAFKTTPSILSIK